MCKEKRNETREDVVASDRKNSQNGVLEISSTDINERRYTRDSTPMKFICQHPRNSLFYKCFKEKYGM